MIHFDLTKLPPTSSVRRTRCFDGDTLRVAGTAFTGIIRIWGIDAPERGQAWYIQSLEALLNATTHIEITIEPICWDRYNRLVARLLGHQFNDIGLSMVHAGHAWWENAHAPDAAEYKAAHVAARSNKLGLWSLPSPHVPPWIFRRRYHQP